MRASKEAYAMPERLPVRANFVIQLPGEPAITGTIDFIARVPGGGRPDGAVERARRAVARRRNVPLRCVRITGVETS